MSGKSIAAIAAALFVSLSLSACGDLMSAAPQDFGAGAGSPNFASEGPGHESNICARDANACLAR